MNDLMHALMMVVTRHSQDTMIAIDMQNFIWDLSHTHALTAKNALQDKTPWSAIQKSRMHLVLKWYRPKSYRSSSSFLMADKNHALDMIWYAWSPTNESAVQCFALIVIYPLPSSPGYFLCNIQPAHFLVLFFSLSAVASTPNPCNISLTVTNLTWSNYIFFFAKTHLAKIKMLPRYLQYHLFHSHCCRTLILLKPTFVGIQLSEPKWMRDAQRLCGVEYKMRQDVCEEPKIKVK
jgi:hypothetical protein